MVLAFAIGADTGGGEEAAAGRASRSPLRRDGRRGQGLRGSSKTVAWRSPNWSSSEESVPAAGSSAHTLGSPGAVGSGDGQSGQLVETSAAVGSRLPLGQVGRADDSMVADGFWGRHTFHSLWITLVAESGGLLSAGLPCDPRSQPIDLASVDGNLTARHTPGCAQGHRAGHRCRHT